MKKFFVSHLIEITSIVLIVVLTAYAMYTIHKVGNLVPTIVIVERE